MAVSAGPCSAPSAQPLELVPHHPQPGNLKYLLKMSTSVIECHPVSLLAALSLLLRTRNTKNTTNTHFWSLSLIFVNREISAALPGTRISGNSHQPAESIISASTKPIYAALFKRSSSIAYSVSIVLAAYGFIFPLPYLDWVFMIKLPAINLGFVGCTSPYIL